VIFLENQIKDIINDNIKELIFNSNNIVDTENIAYLFAKYSSNKMVIALDGELGSGKTIFMKGFAKYYNIEKEVSSPTFTIVNEYSNNIFHFDVYRIKDEEDFLNNIGIDYFDKGICIIEWANLIKNILPKRTIFIEISKDKANENKRLIHIWRK